MLYAYYIVICFDDRDLGLVILTNPSAVRFDQSNRRLRDSDLCRLSLAVTRFDYFIANQSTSAYRE